MLNFDFSSKNESDVVKYKWKSFFTEFCDKHDYLQLYIQIPFCRTFCNYCSFNSNSITIDESQQNFIDEYFSDFLIPLIEFYKPIIKDFPVKAIHVGGGTPSLMSIDQMKKLQNILDSSFNIMYDFNNYYGIESNPSSLSNEKIDWFMSDESHFNRFSLGVQSLDDEVLKSENRVYDTNNTKEYIREKLSYLIEKSQLKGGRVTVDLIHGLKNQTTQSFINDVNFILKEIKVPKLAVYNDFYRFESERSEFDEEWTYKSIKLFDRIEFDIDIEKIYNRYRNVFMKKDFKNYFNYIYHTPPLRYNQCLGLGPGAQSWIVPMRYAYKTSRSGGFQMMVNGEKVGASDFNIFTDPVYNWDKVITSYF